MTADAPRPAAVRFGSCDAEQRWRPSDLARLPALRDPHAEVLTRAMDELQAVLCGPEDVLLTARQPPEAFTEAMAAAGFPARHLAVPGDPDRPVEARLAEHGLPGLAGAAAQPYAVLPGTREAAARLGLAGELPDPETVRRVNSKVWSTALGLPGSGRTVTSVDELHKAVEEFGPCVVKDPYGVSGQGNITVDSPARLDMIGRHLARVPERIELVVQPRFERAADFAAHLTIAPDGGTVWHGIRQILNDGHSYRGSAPPAPELVDRLERDGYRDTVEAVAAAAAGEGYRGPMSVDSMTTVDGGLVPLLEVNARLSPGMIAQRLGARLRLRVLPVTRPGCYERLVTALDDAGLLARAGRPGVLPLAASTLVPPRGWLFYAVLGDAAADLPDLDPLLAAVA
ncbi:hypothetical protein ACGFX4_33990 [Kitasatospora sp. NPDC048365]|uniref:hypothetical protein n=1 Tax=Kitasatospora sp. NPDC048365 TaxID=3364050 RepID=UPI00371D37C7